MLASKLPVSHTKVRKGVLTLASGTQAFRLLQLGDVDAEFRDGVLLDVLVKSVFVPVDSVALERSGIVDRGRCVCRVS